MNEEPEYPEKSLVPVEGAIHLAPDYPDGSWVRGGSSKYTLCGKHADTVPYTKKLSQLVTEELPLPYANPKEFMVFLRQNVISDKSYCKACLDKLPLHQLDNLEI